MRTIFLITLLIIASTSIAQDWQTKSYFSSRKIIRKNDSVVEELNVFNISIRDSLIIHNRIDQNGGRESQLYKMEDVETTEEGRLVIYFRSIESHYFIEIVDVDTKKRSGTMLNLMHRTVYLVEDYSFKTFHDEHLRPE